jgi:hypothetical protein
MALVAGSTRPGLTEAAASAKHDAASFVLGVDLDGVCADFAAGLRPIAAQWLEKRPEDLSPEPTHNYPEWNFEDAGGIDALYRDPTTLPKVTIFHLDLTSRSRANSPSLRLEWPDRQRPTPGRSRGPPWAAFSRCPTPSRRACLLPFVAARWRPPS